MRVSDEIVETIIDEYAEAVMFNDHVEKARLLSTLSKYGIRIIENGPTATGMSIDWYRKDETTL